MHWREKAILEVMQTDGLTTSEIVSRVNMSKATALKYLRSLQEKNFVFFEDIGPTKVWYPGGTQADENKLKVLVVDDDINVINIIRDSLGTKVFETIEAFNGKEALGMVFAMTPDIIILDIMMPDMDGYEVCCELKQHEDTKNIPIIILSAKSDIEEKLKAMGMGINDYVMKPFDPRELKARIKMVLRR